ncbi:MAG: hypothetical protein HY321_17955 [Armatimonadetes bacterium]|nr:hypothetical protein [Armatimonadota bacterium]
MARKHQLREQRAGTVINLTSAKQESRLGRALNAVAERLGEEFGVSLDHTREWRLAEVITKLRAAFPGVPFFGSLPR